MLLWIPFIGMCDISSLLQLYNLFIILSIRSTQYDHVNTTSCYVRIGNTLLYPVINHYGWSDTGFDRPTRCTKSASSVAGSAAHYYCSALHLLFILTITKGNVLMLSLNFQIKWIW